MSAYLVNDDTLDLLSSVACNWGQYAHDDGLSLYFSPSVGLPISEELRERVESNDHYTHLAISNTMSALIKRELLLANLASLSTRYPGDTWSESERSPCRFIARGEVTIGEALGALRCFEYQSCEIESWSDSFAYHLCVAIRRKLTGFIAGDAWEYSRERASANA